MRNCDSVAGFDLTVPIPTGERQFASIVRSRTKPCRIGLKSQLTQTGHKPIQHCA